METHRLTITESHGFEASCSCGLWAIDRDNIGTPGSSRRRKVQGNIARRFADHVRPFTLQGRVRTIREGQKSDSSRSLSQPASHRRC